MEFEKMNLNGLVIIKPNLFEDERGCFFERYNKNEFVNNGIDVEFVQENQSISKKGVIRGLHCQIPPSAQDKFVWVAKGEVYDVAVDLRKDSKNFGKWESVLLSDKNNNAIFIPKGFAHGFQVLSDEVVFFYKVSDFYNPKCDAGINWEDPDLNINWPIKNPIVSKKDQALPFLKDFNFVF
jgi:dTDP-4-dehydrorhamnose 3,5-epimerase